MPQFKLMNPAPLNMYWRALSDAVGMQKPNS
jgi:hypothetical protein